MSTDPFDALRLPTTPGRPDPRFAVALRRQLAAELGLDDDPTTAPTPSTTTAPGGTMPTTDTPNATRSTVIPYICVHDSRRAIEWYGDIFGAVVSYDPFIQDDGRVGHAEITIGNAVVMLSDEFPEIGVVSPRSQEGSSVGLSASVADVDDTYARATAAGATGLRPPEDQFYGERAATFLDPFGHRWMIGTPLETPGA
jgi:uncharacterized glyoxalase superfamily protein PhnB